MQCNAQGIEEHIKEEAMSNCSWKCPVKKIYFICEGGQPFPIVSKILKRKKGSKFYFLQKNQIDLPERLSPQPSTEYFVNHDLFIISRSSTPLYCPTPWMKHIQIPHSGRQSWPFTSNWKAHISSSACYDCSKAITSAHWVRVISEFRM